MFNQTRKRMQSDAFVYDAFVSYSSDDEEWVNKYLVSFQSLVT
jgi:hypothetical protein